MRGMQKGKEDPFRGKQGGTSQQIREGNEEMTEENRQNTMREKENFAFKKNTF